MVAAGIAAPYFFTSAAANAGVANGDKLIVAAIGVGGRGSDIGRQAARLGYMVACADVHLGHANDFAKKLGGKCEVYQDYRKVLDRQDVQAVTIGTPDHWHVKIAIDALKAGKDVYCEKPLTLTIDESKIICRAVKQSGRVFQVGTQQRSEYRAGLSRSRGHRPQRPAGQQTHGQGVRGQRHLGRAVRDGQPPKELDWDFWLGQAPKVPFCDKRCGYTFRWWFDYSGGKVTDWGVHHSDIALWALGGENTGVAEVEGKGEFPLGRQLTLDYLLGKKSPADLPNSYNVAHSFDCTMRLPNGNVINLDSVGNDLLIKGEKGQLAVNRNGIRGKFVEKLKKSPAGKKWLDAEVAKLYRGKPIRGHMANFFDCIKDRSLPISDVFTHCNTVNACHMANIAMLLGRKVAWDREKQAFVGDDEANQLTRRHEREPYVIRA